MKIARLFTGIITATWLTTPTLASEPVVLQGSTTMVTRLMEPYQQDIEHVAKSRLTIVPTKSINGLIALLEGRASLAMISTTLASELPQLRQKLPNAALDQLRQFEITRTTIAFVTHQDNPIKKLTLADIRLVLTGEITSWQAFGWRDIPIRPVFVKNGGVQLSVQTRLLEGKTLTSPAAAPLDRPRQVLTAVMQEPGALALAQRKLVEQAGLTSLTTDSDIEQTMTMISRGEPDARLLRVIEAARLIAIQRLD